MAATTPARPADDATGHVSIPMQAIVGAGAKLLEHSNSGSKAPSLSGGTLAPGGAPAPAPGGTGTVGAAFDPRHTGGVDAIPALPTPMSRLSKLQSYLPTGTWISYTALQTWALSISPDVPPPTSSDPAHQGTCNSDQRIALCVAIALGLISAFSTPFVKSMVVDSDGKRILFPPPSSVKVTRSLIDRVSKARYPYQQQNGRWLWPIPDPKDGGWMRSNGMVKVMEFRQGCEIKVRSSLFDEELQKNDVELIAQDALDSGRDPADMGVEIPIPIPKWKFTLRGPNNNYLDFSLQVWLHALVSMLAFASLALFSTQVTSCIYPSIPNYLPGVAQTATLAIVGFLAAYVIHDNSISFGQATFSPHIQNIPAEDLKDVPPDLQSIVVRVFYVQGREPVAGKLSGETVKEKWSSSSLDHGLACCL